MKEQLIVKNLPFIKILPSWAQELSYKYCSKTANLYIVHGNIRDFLPHKMNEGEFNFVKIQDYVSEVLFGNRDIIVFWDRSSGVSFCSPEMQRDYIRAMKERFPDTEDDELLSSDPAVAFRTLERYFLLNIPQKKRIVMIIDYAETVLPAGEVAKLDESDRYCFVTLNRWSHDPVFTKGDVSVLLLSENLADLNPRIVASPSTIKVEIPIPDEAVRSSFLEFLDSQGTLLLDRGLTPAAVGAITSGLNLVNLNRLAAESWQEDRPISMDYLKEKKREIIEGEAGGLLEFLETEHDLSFVSGHDFVRKRFKHAARALKQGRLDVLPMGYLIAGPVGTGKSFMVSAFAGEIGVPMVKFKNFRSKWQGVTESNLEKVLTILKAMAPVAVMIDEADAFLGDRDQDGDSGTSNRIFAQLASFMGDTEYRGRIIWFLITCRPDLLPIDLKRQGRAEEHLALFYPDNDADKEALFEVLVRKLDLSIRRFPVSELFKRFKHEFSGADLEAVLIRAKLKATMDGRTFVTREDLDETMTDFVPPAYPHEIELQNLVAVVECTSKEMVPRRFQNLDRSRLVKDIQELKSLLGER
ncbi:MAG TPA: AAA family ATPase [Spirochaetales bacterium]|nr:AAA family ATPase [Spirochaetales bacterium]HPM73075.1 AAA family ATPase [Spirochaetales bacterium]